MPVAYTDFIIQKDVNRAKQFLPLLQRAGRMDALVEFVSSGSRFKLYIPKETCVITLLLTGIDCPRLGRPALGATPATPNEEYAEDAYLLSKSLALQREVKVEVEAVDKGGNFLGQITTEDGVSLSLSLVEAGYAAVYKSSSTNPALYAQLTAAELKCKEKRLSRWKNYVEEVVVPKEELEKNEPQERVVQHKKIVVTEVTDDLHFYGQLIDNGPKLEQLTVQLRAELEARPPVPGAYNPKVGDLCVARFSIDDEWYRARVLSLGANGAVSVLYIDYGNREKTQSVKLAALPAGFETLAPQAHEYALALVQLSSDEDDVEAALDRFKELVSSDPEAEFAINSEYKNGTVDFVTLYDAKKADVGKTLISEGFVSVDRAHKERRLQKLFTEYLKVLAQAKASHRNMWKYGDKEQDDAAEFGLARPKA
jgi:staphylococcal nuclease domain-containing protein 1